MWQKRTSRLGRALVLSFCLGLLIHTATYITYWITHVTPRGHWPGRWMADREASIVDSLNQNLSGPAILRFSNQNLSGAANAESSHRSWNISTFQNDLRVITKQRSAMTNTGADYRCRFKPQTPLLRKCRVAPWEQPNIPYNLTTDTTSYFSGNGSWSCFTEGTSQNNGSNCQCRNKWHGAHCSIPSSVWYSDLNLRKNYNASRIKPRFVNYRRIIQAFPFNIEFDMLDARFDEIGNIVDVFMILESNYTAFGKQKPLYLLDDLRAGSYNSTSCKIVHVFLDYFPEKARKNGWVADKLHRDYISSHGLVKQLAGYRDDDIFFLTDADELPSREVLLFLKLHDGYPEPVGVKYKVNIYGFFWHSSKSVHTLSCAVSIGVLSKVLQLKSYDIRSRAILESRRKLDLNTYMKTHKNRSEIRHWSAGNDTKTAGWHCSWCLSPKGIRNKLVSAQNGDFPRWGNYPEKTKITYIQTLIRNGSWFDDRTFYKKAQKSYATRDVPQYFLDHSDVYKHILNNPFR